MTYTLSVAEAASQLSDLVRRLSGSDTVVLMENDIPVAEIVPRLSVPFSPSRTERTAAVEAFMRLCEEAESTPNADDITDEVILAEIAAYRSEK
jgi:antitoxin (DNA-binding transcriptional repressor) of toxin-antitoxin stability system